MVFSNATIVVPGCVGIASTQQGHHGIHHAPLAEGPLDVDLLGNLTLFWVT